MPKKILALGSLNKPEMHKLGAYFDVLKLWEEPNPEEALKAQRENIVGIVSSYNGLPLTKKIIEALPNLSMVAHFGAGVERVDVETLKARDIALSYTPDILTDDTADCAIALTLATLRRIVEADLFVRLGKWHNGAFPLGTSLNRKVMGIVGMGRIGQAIAKRAEAFGMQIVYTSRTEKILPYTFYADLVQMAAASDVLMLSCIGGDSTKHIVNAKVLEALGAKGFVINIARGSVIKTEDLLIALHNRAIAGAGLDVYDDEPDVPAAFKEMDRVVLLPHIGSATIETRGKMGECVIDNLIAHFEGRALLTPYF